MPLIKSNSSQARRKNYLELSLGQMGEARRKAIKTIMRRKKMSFEEARRYQAAIIVKNIHG